MAQEIPPRGDPTLPSGLFTFEDNQASPLSQQQALPPSIKGSHFITCQRSQVVKTAHDETTQDIHPPGHHGGRRPSA
jgi:hypothetical protein